MSKPIRSAKRIPLPEQVANGLADAARDLHHVWLKHPPPLEPLLRELKRTPLWVDSGPELSHEDRCLEGIAGASVYALFCASWVTTPSADTRSDVVDALDALPRGSRLLQRLWSLMTHQSSTLTPTLRWLEEDPAVRQWLASRVENPGLGPILRFYETFLEAFDPALRRARGVYFTPPELVDCMIRMVDETLKSMGLAEGIASDTTWEDLRPPVSAPRAPSVDTRVVQFLDPALGTGAFHCGLIAALHRRFHEGLERSISPHMRRTAWIDFVRQSLLPRLWGLELMPAALLIAHLKVALQLAETGFELLPTDALHLYVGNTLTSAARIPSQATIAPARGDAQPSHLGADAEEIADGASKKRTKHLVLTGDSPPLWTVILGNPPYSGRSQHRGVETLIEPYRWVAGARLNERKSWIHDDYVKFFGAAQRWLVRSPLSVLCFVSSHGYLSGPSFRGMRETLLGTFSSIDILDLHGNVKKRERTPDGMVDQNLFNIQQGVAIGCFARQPGHTTTGLRSADVWGTRDTKRAHLSSWSGWGSGSRRLPAGPSFLFGTLQAPVPDEYQRAWSLPDVFPKHSTGIITARDHFVFDRDHRRLLSRVAQFVDPRLTDGQVREKLKLRENYQWRVGKARARLQSSPSWPGCVAQVLYRPFDVRWILYHPAIVWRDRRALMAHMWAGNNLGLIARRQQLEGRPCTYFGASRLPISDGVIRSDNHGSESLFPLYLYGLDPAVGPDETSPAPAGRRANLEPAFVAAMTHAVNLRWAEDGCGDLEETLGPEDILAWCLAVFFTPAYRVRYAGGLRVEFPRVPLPAGRRVFARCVALGFQLLEGLAPGNLSAALWGEGPASKGPSRESSSEECGTSTPILHPTAAVGKSSERGRLERAALQNQPGPMQPRCFLTGHHGLETIRVVAYDRDLLETSGLEAKVAPEGPPEETLRIRWNSEDWLGPISRRVWQYQIGGYGVLPKWLAMRRRENTPLQRHEGQHLLAVAASIDLLLKTEAELERFIVQEGGCERAFVWKRA